MPPTVKDTSSREASKPFLVRHQNTLILLVLMGIVFFYKLGSYPLFDLDEPRYAEAAREMMERGNWITPYFNYEVRFDKPVFFYWLIALAYQWFGLSEFSARFFSAVTASGTVLMIYGFGRYWISQNYGLFSALILATSMLFIGIARMSITDMTLNFWLTATSLCLFMVAHKDLRWWLAAGFFAGLAVLTKGPVGIVVPGAIFTLYCLAIGQFKRCLLNRWLPVGLLVCLAVALPWYILAYQQNGPIFLDALFLHNVTRYSDVVSGHKQPAYFYALVLAAGFFPWIASLPAAVQQLFSQLKAHRTHVENKDFNYLVPLYAGIWVLFIFCFFNLGNTKLLTYILPLFPALALLTASAWHQKIPQNNQALTQATNWKWLTLPAWGMVVIATVGGLVFITQMSRLLPREAAGVQANNYNLIAVLILILGFLITAWQLSLKKAKSALMSQVLSMALLVVIAMQGIVPNVSKAAQGVMMGYLHKVGNRPVVLYEIQRPSLTFYGKRRVPRFVEEEAQNLRAELNKNKETFIITKSSFIPELQTLLAPTRQVRILEKDRVYSLLSVSQAP